MTILEILNGIFDNRNIAAQVGKDIGNEEKEVYAVLTPLSDAFAHFADDAPTHEINAVRISLYTKSDYTTIAAAIVSDILAAGLTITDKRFIEYEKNTKFYHYNIDAEVLSDACCGI